MKYLLDTNVCVDFLTGRCPRVVHRITSAQPEDLRISSVVVSELRYSAEKSARKTANHARIDILIAEISCLSYDECAAQAYGRIRADLESEGQTIGPYDMMIAAHALAEGLIIVTDNVSEFGRVQGLEVESWRE